MSEATLPAAAPRRVATAGPGVVFACALISGLAAWGFVQAFHPVFEVPQQFHLVNLGEPQEKVIAWQIEQAKADRMNASINLAVLGGLLGGAMALASSACCPFLVRMLAGIAWGAVAGAGAALLGFVADSVIGDQRIPTVIDNVKLHALMFGALGGALGLFLGVCGGSGANAARGVIAGLVSGAVAGFLFPVIASVAIPSATVESVVPDGAVVRLLWIGVFVVLAGLVLPRAVSTPLPTSLSI